jgi:MFS family permease
MKDGPKDGPPKGLSWTQARLVRLTQGGPKGAQASAIGFVLAGPIVGGFLIGWWLDQKFNTQFWVLILGLLGVFSGFRETFMLLKNLQPAKNERTPPPGREKTFRKPPPVVEAPDTSPKPRLFSVPPPPFADRATKAQKSAPQSADDVLRELLGEDEDFSEESPDETQ